MRRLPAVIKNTLNWSYVRGSWQYDLFCLLIIAFIFLTPASLFEEPKRRGSEAAAVREVEASSLRTFLDRQGKSAMLGFPPEAISLYLQEEYHRPVRVVRYEEVGSSPDKLRYRVWIDQPESKN